MLTELELCRKREHKAELRRKRGSGPHLSEGHIRQANVPEDSVQRMADVAMQAGLLATVFAGVRGLFRPRRGNVA